MRLALIAAAVIAADQASKHLVAARMETGQSLSVVEGLLYITYVRNPGAAFGMLPYQTAFFIAITVVVAALIVYYNRVLSGDHRLLRFGLALQLGGALGNLVDRVNEGYVIDFINFTVWPPVFNLADTAIVTGIGLFLIAFWRDPGLRGERS